MFIGSETAENWKKWTTCKRVITKNFPPNQSWMSSVLGNGSYCNEVKDFAFMCEDVEDAPGGGEAPGWHLLLLHLQMSVEGGDQKKVRIKAEDVKCRCPSTWVPPEPWAANQKPANSHLIKFDQWDVEQSIIESKHGTMGIESKAPPGDAGGREAGRSQTLQVRLTNPLAGAKKMPSFDSQCIWEMSYLLLRMRTQLLWGLCPAVLESAISPTPFILRDPSSNAMRHDTSFFHVAIKSMRLNGRAKFKKGQLGHCGYLLFSEAHRYLVRIFYNFTTFFGMRNQKHNVQQV